LAKLSPKLQPVSFVIFVSTSSAVLDSYVFGRK
jgi:hypothetical protein